MKSSFAFPLAVLPLLAIAACTSTSSPITSSDSSIPAISSVPMQETKNVTYQGLLQAAGASIFMEGTHKLQLDDGRFIMLESTAVDLSTYIGMHVQVLGSVRPTVEAGGMIMRVDSVTSLESSSSSSEESMSSTGSSVSSMLSSESSLSMMMPSSSSSSSKVVVSSSSKSSVPSSSSSSVAQAMSSAMPASSTGIYEGSTELTDAAAVMAKDKMDASLWTQQYCTKTAGYCISVHKNWYFKSFGATASTLWHVEVGPQEINNIGEGPLSVNLVAGTSASVGGADGQVSNQGGTVIGYKDWTENRHFELRAPSNLQGAISFMLGTIKPN